MLRQISNHRWWVHLQTGVALLLLWLAFLHFDIAIVLLPLRILLLLIDVETLDGIMRALLLSSRGLNRLVVAFVDHRVTRTLELALLSQDVRGAGLGHHFGLGLSRRLLFVIHCRVLLAPRISSRSFLSWSFSWAV